MSPRPINLSPKKNDSDELKKLKRLLIRAGVTSRDQIVETIHIKSPEVWNNMLIGRRSVERHHIIFARAAAKMREAENG